MSWQQLALSGDPETSISSSPSLFNHNTISSGSDGYTMDFLRSQIQRGQGQPRLYQSQPSNFAAYEEALSEVWTYYINSLSKILNYY